MSVEDNKVLARRLTEGLNEGMVSGLAAVSEFYTDDVVFHSAHGEELRGFEEFRRHAEEVYGAISGVHMELDEVLAEEDKVIRRWTLTGRQTGKLHHIVDLTPTNKEVMVHGITIDRVVGRKFAEEWEFFDTLGMMQQLGFVITPPKMAASVEENKALLRHFVGELSKGEAAAIAVVDETCSADFVQHNAYGEDVRGREHYKRRVADLCRAFPDLHFAIDDIVAEGDKVASRWTMTGTQVGELHHVVDLSATSKKVTVQWITIDRIEGGRFVEAWERFDTLGVMKQLGFELTPPKSSGRR